MIHTGWSGPADGWITSYTTNWSAEQLGVHVKVGVVEEVTDTVSGRLGHTGAVLSPHASPSATALDNTANPRMRFIANQSGTPAESIQAARRSPITGVAGHTDTISACASNSSRRCDTYHPVLTLTF
jgi:hypothetical protein